VAFGVVSLLIRGHVKSTIELSRIEWSTDFIESINASARTTKHLTNPFV
jgi:hypothetical protein